MTPIRLVLCFGVLVVGEAAATGAAPRSHAVAVSTASIRHYNAEEAGLAAARATTATAVVRHWQRLTAIRRQLARLSASHRWPEGERVALRHALSQLLGQVVLIDSARGWDRRELALAAARRRDDLDAIARWSNRTLDFALEAGFARAIDDFAGQRGADVAGATASR